jgi:NAD(P)-dependent dehydrogenase (short-subunit alcohol dehydrogenase family)
LAPAAFITGAAAGIGRATALRFAAAGYLVGCTDIDESGLASLAAEIEAAGGAAWTAVLDVSDPAGWTSRLAEFAVVSGDRLDVLVNNAGILRIGRFADVDLDVHLRTVRVNVDGVVNGCHAAYPLLRATPGAHVVNLCSASAIYGQPELATYSATKFAVRGLTEALELEWAADDITVTALWPLFVDTAMLDQRHAASTESLGVRLGAQDVADAVFDAVRPRRVRRVHRAVGRQAQLMRAAAAVTPGWLLRLSNKRIAKL